MHKTSGLTTKVDDDHDETRKRGNCDALQLEAADASPFPIRFNFVIHAKFEVAHSNRCCRIASLLLIPNLVGTFVRSSLHTKLKNGEDILLCFQTTAAQTSALLSDKPKIALFDPL